MTAAELYLFGSPRIQKDGENLKVGRRKSLAILAYLATTGKTHHRDTLASLLWPESNSRKARANLRRALSDLNREIGDGLLLTEGENVWLAGEQKLSVDVTRFSNLIKECEDHGHAAKDSCPDCYLRLKQAADLYTDDFLAGFTLYDALEFDDWQYFETEGLRQDFAQSLAALVEISKARGQLEAAVAFARRWLSLDPLSEQALREVMLTYYLNDQRSAALRQYEIGRDLLDEQLGVAPDETTVTLYSAIKNREELAVDLKQPDNAGKDEYPAKSRKDASPPSKLPKQLSPFFGRKKELQEISQLLREQESCRLLTLVGPGGMGKTRLAIEVASGVKPDFSDGVFFVSLAPIQSDEFILPAIAEAVEFQPKGEADLAAQLLRYMAQRNMLLVIDNFEHLISLHSSSNGDGSGGTAILLSLLDTSEGTTLLVTSRERLMLQEEWVYTIQGLSFPTEAGKGAGNHGELDTYPSVELFLQRARQGQPSFKSTPENIDSIVRICRLVGGMPLGIELAAQWTRLMSCGEIAAEIESSIDILATTLRDIPDRHRSMRAVLEQSWRKLSAQEQGVLRRLAIFRGGCLRDAAEFVTKASFIVLASLVDKGLLRMTNEGRYELHELIRQFAQEQLHVFPDEFSSTLDLHCRYYTSFLGNCVSGLKAGPQNETLAKIKEEIDNVRAAWRYAVENQRIAELQNAVEGFFIYCETRGALEEAATAFQNALSALEQSEPSSHISYAQLKGFILAAQGAVLAHQGKLQEGAALLEESLSYMDPKSDNSDQTKNQAFALMFLGWVLFLQAMYEEAETACHESLSLYTKSGDRWGETRNLYLLGNSLTGRGKLAEAEVSLQRALQICVEAGDTRNRLMVDWNLGILSFWFGEYDQSRKFIDDAIKIGREFDDQIGLALALKELGKVLTALGDYESAVEIFEESIRTTNTIGSEWETAATYDDYGLALYARGDTAGAERMFRQCLAAARFRKHRYYIARCQGDLALVAHRQKDYRQAEMRLRKALEIWEELGHEPYRAMILTQLGHVTADHSGARQKESRRCFQLALELCAKHRAGLVAMDALTGA
ncbi:MAG: AfsR/SARP family transcriptional regulator, partial [Candidatus Promineifilaceae bacterium]